MLVRRSSRQAKAQGEGGRKDQPGIGHQAMVVKEDADTVGVVAVVASIGCSLFPGLGFCSKTIIPDSEEHPLASSRPVPKAVLRWIRAKASAINGIESVKENSAAAPISEQTS